MICTLHILFIYLVQSANIALWGASSGQMVKAMFQSCCMSNLNFLFHSVSLETVPTVVESVVN